MISASGMNAPAIRICWPRWLPTADMNYRVPKVIMELEAVSSTRIRALLAEGRMESWTAMLGEPYSLSGKIIPGNHIGHTIGTPTINIPPDPSKLLPPYGVYATTTTIGGSCFTGLRIWA